MNTRIGLVLPPLLICLSWSCQCSAQSETPIEDHYRVAFVTSVFGTPVFGDWPEADAETFGLAAADSICVNLATDAGLDSPENFVAWLSDDQNDAYCRLHGTGGKKAANCDQMGLPENAGPWMRTDGTPWAADIAALLDNHVMYTPLRFDENGNPVDLAGHTAWTATEAGGAVTGSTCTNWTARPAELVYYGYAERTGVPWTVYDRLSCTLGFRHLYCLEKFAGPPLPLPEPPGRLAFLVEGVTGDLGNSIPENPGMEGLDAADWVCNHDAKIRGLPGAGGFKAWLSDANTDARDRFVTDGPWYRPDGVMIAVDMADLTDGELMAPISQTANGTYVGETSPSLNIAWTGTKADGSRETNTCNSWTDGTFSFFGEIGYVNSLLRWTEDPDSFGANCGISRRMYCLSDWPIGIIQSDGFEF